MEGLSKIVAIGFLLFGMSGCAHTQVSTDYRHPVREAPIRQIELVGPIRQIELVSKGDCIMRGRDGSCTARVKASLCFRYTDINNNGNFDKGIDEAHHGLPDGALSYIFPCLDSDKQGKINLKKETD